MIEKPAQSSKAYKVPENRIHDPFMVKTLPVPTKAPPKGWAFNFYDKLTTLERISTISFVMIAILFAIVISLLIVVIYTRAELSRRNAELSSLPAQAPQTQVLTPKIVIAEEENPQSSIYINEQGIDIEKTFKAATPSSKLTIHGKIKKEVFGFLPYWMVGKLSEINTKTLTSISYFGLEVDSKGNVIQADAAGKILPPWYTFQYDPKFNEFVKRIKKEKIKFHLTLKCFNQTNIVNLVTNEESIKNFVSNALFLVNAKNLDGINLDFEYIGTPKKEVIDGFTKLVSNLNHELKRQHPGSILTVDTFVDAAKNTRLHDVPVLASITDGLVIMGYDFYTPNSSTAGPVAPFDGSDYSLIEFLGSYLAKAPSEKLILAVPYYGYGWTTAKAEINAPTLDKSGSRVYSYAELADISRFSQINWDEKTNTPWLYFTDPETRAGRVIHFENVRSLGVKYDFVKEKGFQGVGIWALGFDGKRVELQQLLIDKFAE